MVDKVDGSVEIRFDHSHLKKEIPWISMIQVPMDDPKPWSKPRESLINLQYGLILIQSLYIISKIYI